MRTKKNVTLMIISWSNTKFSKLKHSNFATENKESYHWDLESERVITNLFPPVRNSQVWNYHTSYIARFERVTKQKLFKLKGDFFLREQGLISLHWWSNVTFQISLVIFLINKDVEYRYLNKNWISYCLCFI